jgi:hypothetical protein
MKRMPVFFCLLTLIGVVFLSAPSAIALPITLVPDGSVGPTLVFRGDLDTVPGLTQVGSITVVDDGTPVGGGDGIFSGFDVDAIFLDMDGLLTTAGDRDFASSFLFTAGTTRPTSNPLLLPSPAHPGPTFGSLNANTIDHATATLSVLDAVAGTVDPSLWDGWLTLGDGGTLVANFAPDVPVGGTLFLMVGEVGGQPGEGLGASIDVSPDVIPEPATMLLLGSGLIGLAGFRRKFKK